MMGPVVLDASAAVRAVLDPAAQAPLLERIRNASVVIAPALLHAEVGNALWKCARAGFIEASELPQRYIEAMSLVQLFIDDASLFPEVLAVAAATDHPIYDTLYVLCARRHAAELLTFDRRLHALCERERVACAFFKA